MSIYELAAKAGLTVRTVRYYLERKVVPAPEFRGTATRYGREHLLRLLFADKLRRERRIMKLEAIRSHLAGMSLADLEAALGLAPRAANKRPPLADDATSNRSAATPLASGATTGRGLAPPTPATYRGERWERVPLLAGLELHVRTDATALVRRVVQEIYDHCVASAE